MNAYPAGPDRGEPIPWTLGALLCAVALAGMLLSNLPSLEVPSLLPALGAPRATLAGLALATSTLLSALTSFAYERVRRRISHPAVCAAVFLPVALGFAAVAAARGPALLVLAMVPFGAGMGLLVPNLNVWLTGRGPAHARGRLLGALSTAIFLGQFLAPFAAAPLVARSGRSGALGLFGLGAIAAVAIGLGFAASALATARRTRGHGS